MLFFATAIFFLGHGTDFSWAIIGQLHFRRFCLKNCFANLLCYPELTGWLAVDGTPKQIGLQKCTQTGTGSSLPLDCESKRIFCFVSPFTVSRDCSVLSGAYLSSALGSLLMWKRPYFVVGPALQFFACTRVRHYWYNVGCFTEYVHNCDTLNGDYPHYRTNVKLSGNTVKLSGNTVMTSNCKVFTSASSASWKVYFVKKLVD